MLGMQIQPIHRLLGSQQHGQLQLCVPPMGVKGFAYRRVKNDERDAADLADLLRMGRLPEAWIAPPATRELRELVRHRAKLVGLRTSSRLRRRGAIHASGSRPIRSRSADRGVALVVLDPAVGEPLDSHGRNAKLQLTVLLGPEEPWIGCICIPSTVAGLAGPMLSEASMSSNYRRTVQGCAPHSCRRSCSIRVVEGVARMVFSVARHARRQIVDTVGVLLVACAAGR